MTENSKTCDESNGKVQGRAYFETDTSAARALQKTNAMVVHGRQISVSMSNPPARLP